jgi:hypothetical protein
LKWNLTNELSIQNPDEIEEVLMDEELEDTD